MKILIISDQYLPSTRSSSILIHDLIQGLIKKGNKVTLITSTQNKNGRNSFNKHLEIIRVKIFPFKNKSFIIKGLNQIFLLLQTIFNIIFLNKKFDKVFIYCPPLFLGLINIFFKKKKKIINIQDFFPQNAIDLGILKNKILIFIIRKIEKVVYDYSDFILVNSLNSKKYLANKFPQIKKKIIFNYNWIKLNKIKKSNYKRKKFRFIFGGSLGPSQDLKKVFNVFKNLSQKCELHIYGNGISKEDLQNEIKLNDIKNIKIFDPLPNSKFKERLQEYDSALLTLNSDNRTPFIPGKFNFYCSQKKNTTAIVHKKCDLNYIIKNEKLGFVSSQNNTKKLIPFFKRIINSKNIKKLDANALDYAKKNFDVKYIVNKLEKI